MSMLIMVVTWYWPEIWKVNEQLDPRGEPVVAWDMESQSTTSS